MDYLYDNTYMGLMSACYLHYKYKKSSGIFSKNSYQRSLGSDYRIVKPSEEFSQKMEELILEKISKEALRKIYYTFLSNESNKETYITKFVDLGFKNGDAAKLYSHEDTFPLQKAYDKVAKEKHRFLGIIRFKDLR